MMLRTLSYPWYTLLSLYADDVLLYKQMNSLSDYIDLQADINKISGWANAKYLEFNTNKCKTMILTKKSKPGSFPSLQLKMCPWNKLNLLSNSRCYNIL